jgi:hypothetical protein
MRISVQAYIKEVTKGLNELQREVVPRAAQQALNYVVPRVKTLTVRELQSALRLRNQKGLRASIKVVKASKGNLTAEVATADRSIKMDESMNAVVRVTRKRIPGGKGSRKVTTVIFKGQKLDGAIQINLDVTGKGTIRKKDGGRYAGGKRSQRVAPVFAYTQLQEMIRAEIDKHQEAQGLRDFAAEFDRVLKVQLTKLRF